MKSCATATATVGIARRTEPDLPFGAVDEEDVEVLVDAPDVRDRDAERLERPVHLGLAGEAHERADATPSAALQEQRTHRRLRPGHVDREAAAPTAGDLRRCRAPRHPRCARSTRWPRRRLPCPSWALHSRHVDADDVEVADGPPGEVVVLGRLRGAQEQAPPVVAAEAARHRPASGERRCGRAPRLPRGGGGTRRRGTTRPRRRRCASRHSPSGCAPAGSSAHVRRRVNVPSASTANAVMRPANVSATSSVVPSGVVVMPFG